MKKLLAAGVALAAFGTAPALALECTEELASAGERVYGQCRTCHMIGDNAKNRVGPHQNNIINRPVAALEDFKYSKGMVEWGEGKVWDYANLDAYLEAPRRVVRGTRMAFNGLRKEEDRQAVICFMESAGGVWEGGDS